MALPQSNRRVLRQCLMATVLLLSLSSFVFFTFYTAKEPHTSDDVMSVNEHTEQKAWLVHDSLSPLKKNHRQIVTKIRDNKPNHTDLSQLPHTRKENETSLQKAPEHIVTSTLNFNVHVFYYPWYKNEKFDGHYSHWNHELLPHWNDKSRTRRRQHVPPDDIGSNFYPKLGPYSSADPQVLDTHMKQISSTGAGVVAVSWYPPQYEPSTEIPVDNLMMSIMDSAAKYGLQVAFHIEPYNNRSGETLQQVVKYVFDKYSNHSAFYRTIHKGRKLPVFYVYDSYQIDSMSWAEALVKDGRFSVRGTKYDSIFLGLLVEEKHFNHLSESGFDGFYTYFASNGFVYGSSWKNWPQIQATAQSKDLIFVPSIGPGYLDTRVRPWNAGNTKLRLNGRYYKTAFQSALAIKPQFLSITSFNEWHEGTQIEPAVPKGYSGYRYEDYRPNPPEFYLNLTRQFVIEYQKNMSHPLSVAHEHTDTF